jgi:hypothetical protein
MQKVYISCLELKQRKSIESSTFPEDELDEDIELLTLLNIPYIVVELELILETIIFPPEIKSHFYNNPAKLFFYPIFGVYNPYFAKYSPCI